MFRGLKIEDQYTLTLVHDRSFYIHLQNTLQKVLHRNVLLRFGTNREGKRTTDFHPVLPTSCSSTEPVTPSSRHNSYLPVVPSSPDQKPLKIFNGLVRLDPKTMYFHFSRRQSKFGTTGTQRRGAWCDLGLVRRSETLTGPTFSLVYNQDGSDKSLFTQGTQRS